MKKTLVEAGKLDCLICTGCNTIFVDDNMILTPGAKDEISQRKLTTVRGPVPEVCCPPATEECATEQCCAAPEECCDAAHEKLMLGVAVVLKEEYGIEDPAQLQAMSCQVVKAIKANI